MKTATDTGFIPFESFPQSG